MSRLTTLPKGYCEIGFANKFELNAKRPLSQRSFLMCAFASSQVRLFPAPLV